MTEAMKLLNLPFSFLFPTRGAVGPKASPTRVLGGHLFGALPQWQRCSSPLEGKLIWLWVKKAQRVLHRFWVFILQSFYLIIFFWGYPVFLSHNHIRSEQCGTWWHEYFGAFIYFGFDPVWERLSDYPGWRIFLETLGTTNYRFDLMLRNSWMASIAGKENHIII